MYTLSIREIQAQTRSLSGADLAGGERIIALATEHRRRLASASRRDRRCSPAATCFAGASGRLRPIDNHRRWSAQRTPPIFYDTRCRPAIVSACPRTAARRRGFVIGARRGRRKAKHPLPPIRAIWQDAQYATAGSRWWKPSRRRKTREYHTLADFMPPEEACVKPPCTRELNSCGDVPTSAARQARICLPQVPSGSARLLRLCREVFSIAR